MNRDTGRGRSSSVPGPRSSAVTRPRSASAPGLSPIAAPVPGPRPAGDRQTRAAITLQKFFRGHRSRLQTATLPGAAERLPAVRKAVDLRRNVFEARVDRVVRRIGQQVAPQVERGHSLLFRFATGDDPSTLEGKLYGHSQDVRAMREESRKLNVEYRRKAGQVGRMQRSASASSSGAPSSELSDLKQSLAGLGARKKALSSTMHAVSDVQRRMSKGMDDPEGLPYLAARHFRGETSYSPFVSLSSDLRAMVTHEDKVMQSIMRGTHNRVPSPEYPEFPGNAPRYARAPNLMVFSVPTAKLVTPEHVEATFGGEYPAMKRIKERLFVGKDLAAHRVATIENPF